MIGSLLAVFQTILTANMLENLRTRVKLDLANSDLDGVGEDWILAIPVRNEEENLRELLPLLVKQKYRPKEIIFLNDQSTDNTLQVINEFSEKHSWIKVVDGKPLAMEWRGKVWALHQLLQIVETPYVVFMDADVRPESPLSFASFLSFAHQVGLGGDSSFGFISAFPRPVGPLSAHLLMDQIPVHLHYFLPFFRKHFRVNGAVAGCGQLMLLNVQEFKQMGAFARIRHSTHDGLKLARLYQENSKPVHTLDATEVFSVKMYKKFSEAFEGFSRNSYEGDTSLPVAMGMSTMLFWSFVMPYFLWPILIMNPFWAASFMYYLYGQNKLSQEMKWSKSSLLVMPVKGAASVAVHMWGAYRAIRGVQTVWRGRVLK